MVQYTTRLFAKNDYWKIEERQQRRWNKIFRLQGLLDSFNYQYNTSSNRARLLDLVARAERGLISYEKRSLSDLKSFCAARQIDVPKESSRKKLEYIRMLEDSDENSVTFAKFLDLPPELRQQVYAYFIEFIFRNTHGTSYFVPTPPPITQTCTLIRNESMPMFFDSFRLQTHTFRTYSLSHAAISNLEKVPSHLLNQIKKIEFKDKITLENRPTYFGMAEALWYTVEIDFATRHKPARIAEPHIRFQWAQEEDDGLAKTTSTEVKKEFAMILDPAQDAEPGSTKLVKDLIEGLLRVGSELEQQICNGPQ